jgi:YXWGXW repeat-containing protein
MRNVRLFWLALLILIVPVSSFAGVLISVNIAPPVLPVYEQPPCPGDGYIWTPGYWAYGPEGYYWVPGTWVTPPTVGVLWTPGYWGWGNGVYVWHAGYWGPHIGFYGGVNYGFGYFGNGYEGGYWRDRHFYYNRTVNNVTITNVHIYNKTVINNVTVNRISYNGGRGGINARPTHDQEMWGREHHFEATSLQRGHERDAGHNREFFASQNHGRPPVAATSRPREFQGPRVMPTREARAPFSRPEARPIPGPSGRDRSYDRPVSREEMHGGRPPQSGRDYRPESAGPRDNGHGHENGSPHGNAGPHDNRGPHGNGNPHENGPQHEGHSDHGHN